MTVLLRSGRFFLWFRQIVDGLNALAVVWIEVVYVSCGAGQNRAVV